MTFPYPSEPAPDGAYVMGGRYGQDVTESTVTAKQYDMVLTTYGPETAAFSHTFVVPDPDAFEVVVKAVASYFTVSAGTLALRLWPRESWAITGIRELGRLALAVAFLNLLLTLIRVIRSSDDR